DLQAALGVLAAARADDVALALDDEVVKDVVGGEMDRDVLIRADLDLRRVERERLRLHLDDASTLLHGRVLAVAAPASAPSAAARGEHDESGSDGDEHAAPKGRDGATAGGRSEMHG